MENRRDVVREQDKGSLLGLVEAGGEGSGGNRAGMSCKGCVDVAVAEIRVSRSGEAEGREGEEKWRNGDISRTETRPS